MIFTLSRTCYQNQDQSELKCSIRSIEHYGISRYQDLNPFLGTDWHFRGINENSDFCYAILEFYIHKRRSIKEYKPGIPVHIQYKSTGYVLVFYLVKGNGTQLRKVDISLE